jgi:hypothetical protein
MFIYEDINKRANFVQWCAHRSFSFFWIIYRLKNIQKLFFVHIQPRHLETKIACLKIHGI